MFLQALPQRLCFLLVARLLQDNRQQRLEVHCGCWRLLQCQFGEQACGLVCRLVEQSADVEVVEVYCSYIYGMLFALGACHFLFNLALQEGHSLVEHHGRYLFRCHRLQTCQKQRHVGREINVGPHARIPAPAALSILQSLQMVNCRCFVDRHRWRVKQQGQRRCPFPFRLRLGRPRRFSHQHLF